GHLEPTVGADVGLLLGGRRIIKNKSLVLDLARVGALVLRRAGGYRHPCEWRRIPAPHARHPPFPSEPRSFSPHLRVVRRHRREVDGVPPSVAAGRTLGASRLADRSLPGHVLRPGPRWSPDAASGGSNRPFARNGVRGSMLCGVCWQRTPTGCPSNRWRCASLRSDD